MHPNIDPLSLWAILRIKDSFFSVPCDCVQSIAALTDIKSVPTLPKYVRGMMNYRGQVIHLIDMRVRLKMRSLNTEVNEFIELMNAREQDHIDWLDTLQHCVNENKDFTLTTDPCKCQFGKWYCEFLPTVEDIALKALLESFEKPHNSIHRVAIQVKHLLDEGKKMEALRLIEKKKNRELHKMIEIFNEVKRAYKNHNREIIVVLEHENFQFALIVDEVTKITNLSWDNWRLMDEFTTDRTESEYMVGIAEISENNSPVIVLDIPRLFN